MKDSKLIMPDFGEDNTEKNFEYEEVFNKRELPISRLIGSSKIGYMANHRGNLIVFNANIVTKKSGKIWFGDLDLTISNKDLQLIANELKEDLYILREMDARFEMNPNHLNFIKKKQ